MNTFFCFFYTFFAIVLLTLGIPNEIFYQGSPLLGFMALIPLYIALKNAKNRSYAGIYTGTFLACVQLFSSFWLGFFKDFAIFTLGAPIIAYFFMGLILGRFLFYSFRFRPYIRIFIFAALWTLWETVKSTGFLAYPWGTLIITAPKWSILTQFVDITGIWGISFIMSLTAVLCAECIMCGSLKSCRTLIRPAGFTLFLLVCILCYGMYQYNRPWEAIKTLNTVIVQQNVDPWDSTESEILQKSQNLTRNALSNAQNQGLPKPDLVSWSEGVLSYSYPHNKSYYDAVPHGDSFINFLNTINVPLLTGGPIIEKKSSSTLNEELIAYNSTLFFKNNSHLEQSYGKIQLVPFAEFIPFMDHAWMKSLMQSVVGFSSGWEPGKTLEVFTLPLSDGQTVHFTTPICFEDAFPSICRQLYNAGSEVFINLTNDAWSKTASAEYQHYAISSFRAIEFRTTLVRSTNAGYSVVLDPRGVILADMPLFEATTLYTSVPIYERIHTFYARFGDWFPYMLLILLVILIIYINIKPKGNSFTYDTYNQS